MLFSSRNNEQWHIHSTIVSNISKSHEFNNLIDPFDKTHNEFKVLLRHVG